MLPHSQKIQRTPVKSAIRALHALILVSCLAAATAGRPEPAYEENHAIDCKLKPEPPKADRRPHVLTKHGDEREDFYFWLQDEQRNATDVLSYLRAENNYTDTVVDQKSTDLLFEEMRARIQEEDLGTPRRVKNYFYYSKKLEGQEHGGVFRRKIPDGLGPHSIEDTMDESTPEQVILDMEKEAEKHEFYLSSSRYISPNEKLVAYSEDVTGAERFNLYIKEIETGAQLLPEPIANTLGRYAWSADSSSVFYITRDPRNRPDKLWRHDLNSTEADTLVYDELNPGIWLLDVKLSRDEEAIFVFIYTSATTYEHKFLDPKNPRADIKTILAAQPDVRYTPDHRGGYFYSSVLEGQESRYKFVVAPMSDPSQQKVLISGEKGATFMSFALSKNFLATLVLNNGVYEITIFPLPECNGAPETLGEGSKINFDEPAYRVSLGTPGGGADFDSDILRITYTSMTTPETVIDIDMRTGKRATKKIQPVLGGFDRANYATERIFATAPDGVEIPMSLVYRKDKFKRDGTNDALVSVYGAHEIISDPRFSFNRLSTLDRGFVYVLTHLRGGGFFGREWYDAGRNLNKRTTFSDAIACVEHLIDQKYAAPGKISIAGGSSGGLAVGAIINARPELFRSATLIVPLVDLLTKFLDETSPIVRVNYPEFGNPHEKPAYDYIKSYSPVDNIQSMEYPHVYVTAGLTDPRVEYWGPAKYVAKLRHMKTDSNEVFLKTDLSSGHGAKSGRFDRLKDDARAFAFLLKAHGKLGGFCHND